MVLMCMLLTHVINHWASTYDMLAHSIAISDSGSRDPIPRAIVFNPPTKDRETIVCCSTTILVSLIFISTLN